MTRRDSIVFYVLIVVSMALWAASWISAKAIANHPASVSAFWRFALMFVSFLPLLWANRERPRVDRAGLTFTLLSAAALTIYNVLFFWGLHSGYAGKHGVLTTTMNPLFAFVWAALFRLRQGGLLAWAGLGLGFVGGAIQMLGDRLSWESFTDPTGLIFVASAAVYALLTVFGQLAQKTVSLFTYSAVMYGLSTLALLPLAWAEGAFRFETLDGEFWLNIAFIALLVGSFATSVYFHAARAIGAARAASFTFLIPVLVVILSYLAFGEVPEISSLVGGALSLLAVLAIQRDARKETAPSPVGQGEPELAEG